MPEAGEEVGAGELVAVVGGDRPGVVRVVVGGGRDTVAEADVTANVEAVGHEADVALHLLLAGVALGPVPFLFDLREGEAVRPAFTVGPGARVPVPVPGAADVGSRFERDGGQSEFLQFDEHAHTGEAGTDDQGIGVGARRRLVLIRHLVHSWVLVVR